MKKRKRVAKDLGIPKGVSAELRKELTEELQRMGATYTELAQAADVPVSPEQLLKLVKRWNRLGPMQKAAWDYAAQQQNLSGSDSACRN